MDLEERMRKYEEVTDDRLPRRTYTIIRLDGKAFHTFTKGFRRPYDEGFMGAMNEAAAALCGKAQGARFAYVQSDEINLLLTDFDQNETEPWFDCRIQKMASVSASIVTAAFNAAATMLTGQQTFAEFDSRVFTIPDSWDVYNYFLHRQNDATRNSISAAAQSHFSPNQLHGKDQSAMQDMLMSKGVNWNNYPDGFKRGRFIEKVEYQVSVRRPGGETDAQMAGGIGQEFVTRRKWSVVKDTPIFSKDKDFLHGRIPKKEAYDPEKSE